MRRNKSVMGLRSGLEDRVALRLGPLAQTYEMRKLAYVKQHTYTPDFWISDKVAVEVKGRFLAADRSKLLHVRKFNPDIEIILVFQDPTIRISKVSKITYARWCEKNGFHWFHETKIDEMLRWAARRINNAA